MHDPVLASDGNTYERQALRQWFARGNRTSPATRQVLSGEVRTNRAIRNLIEGQVDQVLGRHQRQDERIRGDALGRTPVAKPLKKRTKSPPSRPPPSTERPVRGRTGQEQQRQSQSDTPHQQEDFHYF